MTDVGFEILPNDNCPTCGKLDKHRYQLQNDIITLENELEQAEMGLTEDSTRTHKGPENCPTYYDGCHCSVLVLRFNIARAEKAEEKNITLQRLLDLATDRIKLLEALT